jgi:8-hydroxy-5-deazaflavin:NADPH oxidoreductase
MRIGILGGGSAGQTLGGALVEHGHEVAIGIRRVSPETLAASRNQAGTLGEWQARTGGRVGTMEEAASDAELVFNATRGDGSLEALRLAGAENLAGKVLIDVSNPLDFSQGMPPFLMAEYSGPSSLGEQIQAEFPEARVVKAFNTVTAAVMVNPGLVPGEHDLFLAGNDEEAKETVRGIARSFGWASFVDLGDIKGARAAECFLPIWVRLWMTGGTAMLGWRIVKASPASP